jgi:chondroitin AC lyase
MPNSLIPKQSITHFHAKSLFFCALISFSSVQCWAAASNDNTKLIIDRYAKVILSNAPSLGDANAIGNAADKSLAQAKSWARELDADGRWSDINYDDQSPSNWAPRDHLLRLRLLSYVAATSSTLSNDIEFNLAIDRALAHWNLKRYQCKNWWHNNIGTPQLIRDIVILRGEKIQGNLLQGALNVWKQYASFKDPGGGQNTVWRSELAMEYGAYVNDLNLVTEAADSIAGEIRIAKGEGIQPDFSFHQHGARLQQLHYGGDFLKDTARLAWQLRGTPWAFSDEKTNIVANMLLEGSAWMVRGTSTVPSTIDRQVSRPEGLEPGHGDLRASARFLSEVIPARAKDFQTVIERQSTQDAAFYGFRSYPSSDFSTYHRPTFSFFQKSFSTRTRPSESINGENLKGQRLTAGDHYLLRDGNEYAGLPPVWDWNLLPGVTSAAGVFKLKSQAFAGTVSDGKSGAGAMLYAAENDGGQVSAKKFWAMSGDTVVFLIADLNSDATSDIRTALDQSSLRGAVTIGTSDGKSKPLGEDALSGSTLRWIHHNGLAYFPPEKLSVSIKAEPTSGTWKSINNGRGAELVTKPVFLPVIEHGKAPQSQNLSFAIASAPTPIDAEALSKKQPWKIIQNNASIQAVAFNDGKLMAVFYQAGTLINGDKQAITSNAPCMMLMQKNTMYVSDPLRTGKELLIQVGKREYRVNAPTDGSSLTVNFN